MSIRSLGSMPQRDGSFHSSTLLTPPQTPTTPNDTPFKPKDGDKISLGMKRRHRGQHEDNILLPRECVSNSDLRNSPPRRPSLQRQQSQSVPNLRGARTFPISRASPLARVTGSGSSENRCRRWTLPSKAPSTTYLAHTAFTVPMLTKAKKMKQPTKDSESPAMITLRRATNLRASPRKISLTFFPEPTFQRTRSGFFSSFLGNINGAENKPGMNVAKIYQQDTRRSSRSASVDSGKAQPSSSESAHTVCTEVTGVEPRLSIPGQDSSESPLRRCSTRFISAGSVYEVIWDENGSSASSETPPPQPEPEPVASKRGRSVAVEQLELQLCKAEAQSRRESLVAQALLTRTSSIPRRAVQSREHSLGELLTFKLSRSASDSFIHHLPQAQTPRAGSLHSHPIMVVPEEENEDNKPPGALEFFPLLRSRDTTDASKTSTSHTVDASAFEPPSAHSTTPPDQPRPRIPSQTGGLGSMIGVSTHVRRGSTAPDDWFARRRSNALGTIMSRKSSAFTQSRMGPEVEDDTTLLLSRLGMFNSWNT